MIRDPLLLDACLQVAGVYAARGLSPEEAVGLMLRTFPFPVPQSIDEEDREELIEEVIRRAMPPPYMDWTRERQITVPEHRLGNEWYPTADLSAVLSTFLADVTWPNEDDEPMVRALQRMGVVVPARPESTREFRRGPKFDEFQKAFRDSLTRQGR